MQPPPQLVTSFRIAGITCAVLCAKPAFWTVLPQGYAEFATEADPDLGLTVEVIDSPSVDSVGRWSGPYARIAMTDGVLTVVGPGFQGAFDTRRGQGRIEQPLDPAPFEAFVTAVYAWRLLEEGGFLLHAAGLIDRDGVAAFFGPSGSGKSTVAALVGGGVISDEVIAIRHDDAGFHASGVPWRGRPISGRVMALYALRKAASTEFARLTGGVASRHLLSSVFLPCADAATVGRVLDISADLLAAVPCYEMQFTADRSFWPRLPHRQSEEVSSVAL
jgi:hypothetical protein